MVYDILIIGGGAAAMTAALYASRSGNKVKIIERDHFGGQIADSPKVENFPTIPSISGLELSDHMFEQISALGVEAELDDILKIEKRDNIFYLTGNYETYLGKTVIIASGAKHRHLNIPLEDKYTGKGVSYCAVCDGPFYEGKRTLVIGDGNSALQYTLLLAKTSSKVDLVTLTDKFFADKALIASLNNLKNVAIHHNMASKAFYGNEERLEGIIFENTLNKEQIKIETDGVFVAIGQMPDNDRFSSMVDLDKGFILTNENMETKTPGLFAAGDCRKKNIRQLVTACNDGAIAALSANKYLNSL